MTNSVNVNRITTLIRDHKAGSAFTDVNMSGAGVAAKRKQLTDAAIAKAAVPLDADKAAAQAKVDKARTDALSAIRTRSAESVALQDIARQKVEVLLKSGRDLAWIIKSTTDSNVLAAVIEWGPTWVQAATPFPTNKGEQAAFVEPNTDWIEGAALDRLGEMGGWSPLAAVGAANAAADDAQMWSDLAASLVTDGMKGTTAAGAWSQLHESDQVAYDTIRAALA